MNWKTLFSRVGFQRQAAKENSSSIPPSRGITILVSSPWGDSSNRTNLVEEDSGSVAPRSSQRKTLSADFDGISCCAGTTLEHRRDNFMCVVRNARGVRQSSLCFVGMRVTVRSAGE